MEKKLQDKINKFYANIKQEQFRLNISIPKNVYIVVVMIVFIK